MSDNSRKTPFAVTQHRFAERKIEDFIEQLQKSLPCTVKSRTGQIVTVTFNLQVQGQTVPPMIIPIATSVYDWLPIQPGDKGLAVPSDVFLGGISGIGSGIAGPSTLANLTSLVFVPVTNAAWTFSDTNMRVAQGPDGVVVQSLDGSVVGTFSKADGITLTAKGHTLAINSEGIVLDGIVFGTHEHTGVETGGSNTGGPVSG